MEVKLRKSNVVCSMRPLTDHIKLSNILVYLSGEVNNSYTGISFTIRASVMIILKSLCLGVIAGKIQAFQVGMTTHFQ